MLKWVISTVNVLGAWKAKVRSLWTIRHKGGFRKKYSLSWIRDRSILDPCLEGPTLVLFGSHRSTRVRSLWGNGHPEPTFPPLLDHVLYTGVPEFWSTQGLFCWRPQASKGLSRWKRWKSSKGGQGPEAEEGLAFPVPPYSGTEQEFYIRTQPSKVLWRSGEEDRTHLLFFFFLFFSKLNS